MSSRPERDRGALAFRAAIAMMLLLFALFPLVLGGSLYLEWGRTLDNARSRADSAAQVVGTNVLWISELSRQALARIDTAIGPDIDQVDEPVIADIEAAMNGLPAQPQSYIFAADGTPIYASDPAVLDADINVRDRRYFSELAQGADWSVSSLLISRFNGEQVFAFSRRIERDGAFVGAAVIAFQSAILRDIWLSLGFDQTSTVSLVRGDGALAARYPYPDGPLDLGDTPLFTEQLAARTSGVYRNVSPIDAIERIVAYRRVPGTPFVAVAAISTDSALANFRRGVVLLLVLAIPGVIALGLAIAFIARLLMREQQNKRALADTLAENSMLIRDTHHRVKNNLQAIMSMIRMHPISAALKRDLQARVAAMSAVHEHLYRLDRFTEVSAKTLVPDIVEKVRNNFGLRIPVTYELDDLIIDHDHATPFALLMNELVTNAYKHAFPTDRTGEIRIAFRETETGEALLVVEDTGVGRADGGQNGLGSRLIRAMLAQLDAQGGFDTGEPGGTTFRATLPVGVRLADENADGPPEA